MCSGPSYQIRIVTTLYDQTGRNRRAKSKMAASNFEYVSACTQHSNDIPTMPLFVSDINNNNNNCPTEHCERRSVGRFRVPAAIADGGLFTDTGVDEWGENERQSENDCEMKTVSSVKEPENRQELVLTRLRRKGLFKETSFEFRVKLMWGQASRGEESVAVPSDGGAEGCRSCFVREFQSMGKRPVN